MFNVHNYKWFSHAGEVKQQAWLPDQADQGEFISSKYRIVLRRPAGVKVSPGSGAAY